MKIYAKDYTPVDRAEKPHIVYSIFALAKAGKSSIMTGNSLDHEFAEIFHPTKYPDYIVYNYIRKFFNEMQQVEYAFRKSDFSDEEWASISKAATNREKVVIHG
jgi:hypothetical protein